MAEANHIRNPIEWGRESAQYVQHAFGSAAHAIGGSEQARSSAPLAVRRITIGDLRDVLARGLDDFAAYRTDVIFYCLIYPVVGLILARLVVGHHMLPLIFPLASGFALVGPIAAIGLYEMSRRREQGAAATWGDAFGVIGTPAIGAIVTLGVLLLAIFGLWLATAYAIYDITLGPRPPVSIASFVRDVLTTRAGWAMTGLGIGVGFLFAVLVLTISVVSFPLLIDRDVGVFAAVSTSVRAVLANPGPLAVWGLIVATGLVVGSIPFLIGLAIVLPVLGHATWHLYRKLVPREGHDPASP
jgi:uncharacterized membrane protein